MDRATLSQYAERLSATGLHFARLEQDPHYAGKRMVTVPIPWDQVIVRFAAAGGYWTMVDQRAAADPAQLRLVE